jgi:NADH:ubiquinone oxidoreductase subunit E
MEKVIEIIESWGGRKDCLIEMLQDVQGHYNYLPEEALGVISSRLNIPLTQVTHVATFYSAFSLKPQGKYRVAVCTGTSCYVKGATQIVEAFERELKVQAGETSPDGLFSLQTFGCKGCCGIAPVVTVNDDEVLGRVKSTKAAKIVKELRDREGH